MGPQRARLLRWCTAGLIAATTVVPMVARGGPTVGFVEEFPGTSISTWAAGQVFLSNPGTGGFNGAGDGYLRISTGGVTGRLAARSDGPEYAGDWSLANVGIVRFALNDVDANQALEIHFAIGNVANFWLSNQGFSPPENAWGQFSVTLTPANFTRIIGTDTFLNAIATVDRIQFRHDVPPLQMTPTLILGEFGVDHIELLDAPTAAKTSTWGRIKSLYR